MSNSNAIREIAIPFALITMLFVLQARAATLNEAPLLNQATVTATVSRTDIQVAEPFMLDLKVTAPTGTKVALPPVGEMLGDFEIIDHQDIADVPSESSPEQRIWTRRLKLESIATGNLEIPALEVRLSNGSAAQSLTSKIIPLRVISVLENRAEPTQIRDIHSVVDIIVPQPPSTAWVGWTASGLGLLTLCTATFAVVARRKTWLTPSQWAIQALESLRNSPAFQSEDSEAASQALTWILRDYLELQFEMSAPMQTTAELLHVINARELLQPELAKRFGDLFAIADQSKFAGLKLTESELNAMIDEAKQLIDQNQPEPQPNEH